MQILIATAGRLDSAAAVLALPAAASRTAPRHKLGICRLALQLPMRRLNTQHEKTAEDELGCRNHFLLSAAGAACSTALLAAQSAGDGWRPADNEPT